jgi:ABC-2 type transport system permease protein
MPIFDQGYQHWQGKLSGHTWRWLTIARCGVRTQSKVMLTRGLILVALIPALLLAGFMVLWGMLEQKSNSDLLFLLPVPPAVKEDPADFRVATFTYAYQIFYKVELYPCLLMLLLIGPNLISKDLRFNAIPLYLSRPVRRLHYFLGKLGILAFYLGGAAILPALLAYLLALCFSLDLGIVPSTIRLLGASILYGVIIVLSGGTLMLALSSLSRNSRYVAILGFGFWAITAIVGNVLTETVGKDWCPIISYQYNLQKVCDTLLDVESAEAKWEEAEQGMFNSPPAKPRPGQPGAGKAQPPGQPNPPQQAPPRGGRPVRSRFNEPEPKPPWYWSAAVLAGLMGLSLCLLTSRVKSLDRLK